MLIRKIRKPKKPNNSENNSVDRETSLPILSPYNSTLEDDKDDTNKNTRRMKSV